jgi:hypothetical protein
MAGTAQQRQSGKDEHFLFCHISGWVGFAGFREWIGDDREIQVWRSSWRMGWLG